VFNPNGDQSITDGGGPKLKDTPIWLIFWGSYWNGTVGQSDRTAYCNAIQALINTPVWNMTDQYGANGKAIYEGQFTDTITSDPGPTFSDGFLHTVILDSINARTSPLRAPSSYANPPIYCVITPPGVASTDPEAGGYHQAFQGQTYAGSQDIIYAWLSSFEDSHGNPPVSWMTDNASHEIAEAKTDPQPFSGVTTRHYYLGHNEICDGEAENYRYSIHGVLAQSMWNDNYKAYTVCDGNSQNVYVLPQYDSNGKFAGTSLSIGTDQLGTNFNDTVTIDNGPDGGVFVNFNGETFTFGAGAITEILLNTGGGHDTVNIQNTNVPVRIQSTQLATVNLGNSSTGVQGIKGQVYLINYNGTTDLNIDDTADTQSRAVYQSKSAYGAMNIDGLAPAEISYYNGNISSVTIECGSGNNMVAFQDTLSDPGTLTRLHNGPGQSTVYVFGTGAHGSLDLDASGSQAVYIGSNGGPSGSTLSQIQANVYVHNSNPNGSSDLYVDDRGDTTGRTANLFDGIITGLAPAYISWSDGPTFPGRGGVNRLTVYSGAGDTWNVYNTSPLFHGTFLHSGGGSVNVRATSGALDIDGDYSRQTVTIGSLAPLLGGTVAGINGSVYVYNSGSSGTTTLTVDDSLDWVGHTVSMYDGRLIGLAPAWITWQANAVGSASGGVIALSVYGGYGSNTWWVDSTSPFYLYTYLNAGNGTSGVDAVYVEATSSFLAIDGGNHGTQVVLGSAGPVLGGTLGAIQGALDIISSGSGDSSLTIDDSADPTSRAVSLTNGGISGLAPATISWAPASVALGQSGVNSLTILGGSGGNTWLVSNTGNLGSPTLLETGTGNDSIYVQGTTGGLNVDNSGGQDFLFVGSGNFLVDGTMANIQGAVNAYGAGSTVLYLGDGADTTARTVTLSDSAVAGLAPAPIFWTHASGTTGGVTSLFVQGSSAGSTYTVTNTSPFATPTILETGGGSDTVYVLATTGALNVVNLGGPDATIVGSGGATGNGTLAGILGAVNVSGAGSTALYLGDAGDGTSRTVTLNDGSVTGLSPAALSWTTAPGAAGGVTSLVLAGSLAPSTYTVTNATAFFGTTLTTGPGNDTVNVLATLSGLNVGNNGGLDTVTVGSQAPALGGNLAAINGYIAVSGMGSTSLIVDDSGDTSSRTATLTVTQLTGLGNPAAIYYLGGVTALTVDGSRTKPTTFSVAGTFAGMALTLNGGAGADVFNLASSTQNLSDVQGAVTVHGNGGADTVNVLDQSSGAAQTYHLTATTLTRSGAGTLTYDGVKTLKVTAGAGDDACFVDAVPGAATAVDLGGGTNTLTGPNAGNIWTITSPNAGKLDQSVTFSNAENLVGNAKADLFRFVGLIPSVSGTIAGGGGRELLDYSGYTWGPIAVNLQTATATLVNGGAAGGFTRINGLVGSPNAGDTLIGPDAATTWLITGTTNWVGAISFSAIENIVGGAGDDSFRFTNGASLPGTIDGGAGSNTLNYAAFDAAHPITVNLAAGTATGTAGIANIQNVTGGAGNDTLIGDAANNVLRDGSGNDTIIGGSGNDILISGSGNDILDASRSGRSILIGGPGAAQLTGGAQGDILIGGSTILDDDTAALVKILAEWTSADSYATRILNIRNGTGLAGGYRFNANTVKVDTAKNVLTGGINPSDLNWYWAGAGDILTDRQPGEQVN
jgi:hypothetical protein